MAKVYVYNSLALFALKRWSYFNGFDLVIDLVLVMFSDSHMYSQAHI